MNICAPFKKAFWKTSHLSGKGAHGNHVQTIQENKFQFALANIYVGSPHTTIQVEYNTLMQHMQQTTFKSTIQIFE